MQILVAIKLVRDILELVLCQEKEIGVTILVEKGSDSRKRKPQGPQGENLIEPAELGGAVATTAARGPAGWAQERELVVISEGPYGDAGCLRQLANRPLARGVARHGIDSRS